MPTISETGYTQSQISILALSMVTGIGSVLLRQLVAYTGSPEEAISAPKRHLEKIPGIGQALIANIENEREVAVSQALQELTSLEENGGTMHCYLDKTYPTRLKSIPDGPLFLFTRGRFNFENPRILAVVGTRQASQYGKQALEEFTQALVPYNPVIVSGLAYGIDIGAHKAAIHHGLETWGVMATGVDTVYPAQHRQTAQAMMLNGGILTENFLKTKPDAPRFPARNRIIAGLADAILVVEAMEKGGALITARLGVDYFKDVFAMPGSIYSKSSEGCNMLIRSNTAGAVTSGIQLAESMGWEPGQATKNRKAPSRPADLETEDHTILDLLELHGQLHIDELAWRSQIAVNQLASRLLGLEFQGLVRSLPGKKFGKF